MSRRRDFLQAVGLMGAMAVLPSCRKQNQDPKILKTSTPHQDCTNDPSQTQYAFFGEHQAGIDTPLARSAYFLVLDLHTQDQAKIKKLFEDWTLMSARLTQGQPAHDAADSKFVPPTDTGEAMDLGAYGLTLTFGVSPSFLKKLGLDDKAPNEFRDLPKFSREQLKDNLTGGDICIIAQSDDAQVCFHAVRQLVRHGREVVSMRWAQMGFLGSDGHHTPRNLFAFKDGTANARTPKDAVWIKSPHQWINGGSYLVARLIAMHLETWDRTSLSGQQDTFARHRDSGAPLGQKDEFADFHPKGAPDNAHTSLAHATGQTILRRSYSYVNGIDSTAQFDTGLLFLSFQQSPQQFIDIQNALGRDDKMNEYTTHIGSGLFAIFGGIKDGGYLGQELFV